MRYRIRRLTYAVDLGDTEQLGAGNIDVVTAVCRRANDAPVNRDTAEKYPKVIELKFKSPVIVQSLMASDWEGETFELELGGS